MEVMNHKLLEEKLLGEEIVTVQKVGDYFNWRTFKKEPCTFFVFTKHRVIEYGEV